MADKTRIQWADATFNPWWGCEKVSPACAHCYAERDSSLYGYKNLWGPKGIRRFFGEKHWNAPLKWNEAAVESGKPFRVFCASMADVFEDRRDLDAPRGALFDLIEATPALTWMLLTKRPQNMVRLAPPSWRTAWPKNVWAMATVENQVVAAERIQALLQVPAAVLGVSIEPLLGSLRLDQIMLPSRNKMDALRGGTYDYIGPNGEGGGMWDGWTTHRKLDWVIVGGESEDERATAREARPMHPVWARDLRDQCVDAGVAFFFKQWGAWAPLDGDEWLRRQFPDVEPGGTFPMKRVGKERAGRLLFGREWNEVPTIEAAQGESAK